MKILFVFLIKLSFKYCDDRIDRQCLTHATTLLHAMKEIMELIYRRIDGWMDGT